MPSRTQNIQSAWIGTTDGGSRLAHDAPIPAIARERVLIKTKAVSVSPVDSKLVGPYVTPNAVAGFDFSGIVEELGPEATKCGLKVGDRVCSAVVGMNPADPTIGAFAEYTAAVEWILLKLPPSITFEQGATLGISFLTSGLALFRSLGIPGRPLEPAPKPLCILVYGGSSSCGTASLQLLREAGHIPITTCSPHNFELVKSYGAVDAFDYNDPDTMDKIKKYTKNGLRYALDCISTTSSMQFCYKVIGRAGGKYTSLEPFSAAVAQTRKVVSPDWVMGPSLLGQEVAWPEPHYRKQDDDLAQFGAEWTATLNQLLKKELIKPHPMQIRDGGLENIQQGLEDLRAKKVSGAKIVYPLGS
uniref:Trans-enoyl reductase pvhC n=1 Tax=Talaromyces variabilis TaxID=28576 RepID=PVHC_TALVA|nr:RecName: Full=Trans-enoyl reductase pvhC; Short=ER pvhC; AltName: Full=Varicidin biosynthesis cluster protein C [Talaromyces variabilis]AZZ09612.1 PvhC [Talaromyces variabilis]